MTILFALLLATRLFHPETIDSLAASRQTHVEVAGRVAWVRTEADGDTHFRLADRHGHWIVCEIVPYHLLPKPRRGWTVIVRGIRRFDNAPGHGYPEIHPVESWQRQE